MDLEKYNQKMQDLADIESRITTMTKVELFLCVNNLGASVLIEKDPATIARTCEVLEKIRDFATQE